MIERLDEKCKGCEYDGTEEGVYFCLCCTLMGECTPHIIGRGKKKNSKGKTRGPKKYTEKEQLKRRKEDHDAILNGGL